MCCLSTRIWWVLRIWGPALDCTTQRVPLFAVQQPVSSLIGPFSCVWVLATPNKGTAAVWEPISGTHRLDTTLCCCQSGAYLPKLVAWACQLHTDSNYDCICISRFGPREAGDGEMRQGATGRRQGGGRKTTGKRQEGDREATGNSDRRATGGNDRRATGERQEGARQKVAWRQETTGSDRKRQASDRRAAGKRQGSDRGATGERQDSDREAIGKRQGSDRGLKVPKQRQGRDREATGWRQEGEVARI